MFDWRLGILIFNVIIIAGNIAIYLSLKLNDIKHISIAVDGMSKKIDKIFTRLGKVEKIQYGQEKICDERHLKKKK